MDSGSVHQFQCSLFLSVIHFDQIIGPNLLQIYPEIEADREKRISKVLQQLIDVGALHDRKEWEFIYSDRYFSSLNLYLTILNSNARGGREDFMISLIISPTYSQIVSAMVMDWNSLIELKLNCMDLLTNSIDDLNQVKQELLFILATNIQVIKETILSKLELMSPGRFSFE
jgi:hypothetical protein